MIILLLSLIGFAGSFAFFLGREKGKAVIDAAVEGITAYLFTYIISTATLLVFDSFSIRRSCIVCLVLWVTASVISYFKGNRPEPDYNIKSFVIPVIVSILAVPFITVAPFEYFAMGQDEGVYQTEAIMYIRDKNSKQFNFAEYDVADTEQFKQEVIDYVTPNNILGTFYYNEINLEMLLTGNNTGSIGANSLVFHGLHTVSAMLAWWGAMFGIRNMTGVNGLIYILSIFWVHMICRRLNIGKIGKFSACFIFMLSPIVIWVSKSALTEAGLTLIWLVIIYMILGERRSEIILSGLLIGLFGLYHVSAYAFIPLFVFLYVALFLYTANKEYIHAMMIGIGSFFVSFIVDLINACGYTLMNYGKIYSELINRNNIIYIITAFCFIIEIASVILLKLKIRKVNFNRKALRWIIRALLICLMVFGLYRIIKDMPPFRYVSYLTIVSMAIMSGIVIPMIIFFSFLIKTDKWTDDKKHLILTVLFIYCIVIYSMVMLPSIPEYYYYARYFAMYIPIICILGAVCIDRIPGPAGIIAIVVSAAILMPHSLFLMNNKDDTRVQWDSLTEIEDTVQFNRPDAIVMRSELYMLFYYEFRSLDIPVYPITDNFDENIKCLERNYETIYIMDYTFDERFESECSVVRRFLNVDTQDLGQHKTKFFLLPNDTTYNMQTVTLYRWESQE